jgi:hypothetical protein
MPFVLNSDRIRSASDPETGALMVIDSGLQIEYLFARFSSPNASLFLQIERRRKYPDMPRGPKNPGILISAGLLDVVLRNHHKTFDENNQLVDYVLRMICFINKYHALATSPYLWSDYADLPPDRHPVYRMPSDEELVRLSLDVT